MPSQVRPGRSVRWQCRKAINGEKGMDVRTLRVLGVGHGFLRG